MWLGEQDGDALVGEAAHEHAHVAHAGGVQAGGRLVEDEQRGVADQRPGDAEPLAHAVRVAADLVALPVGQLHGVERRVDPALGAAAVERGDELEVAAAGEVGVEARRLHESGHPGQRPRPLDQRVAPEQLGDAGVRADEAEQHAQRGRLAGAVGAEEPVDVTALHGQVDVVDRRHVPVALDQAAGLDRPLISQ